VTQAGAQAGTSAEDRMLSIPEARLALWRFAVEKWYITARKHNNCCDYECLLIAATSCQISWEVKSRAL
jgi:hypothetical protein